MQLHRSAAGSSFGTSKLRFLLTSVTVVALLIGAQRVRAAGAEDPTKPNLITVDVFVADNLGHPFHGLDQQSFTLLDNGQSRQLVSFRAVDPTAEPGAVRVLMVVDMVNNTVTEVARQREQISEFLNREGGKLAHPMAIAVMTESGVSMMKGYSQDGHELLDAFDKVQSQIRPVGTSAGFYGAAEHLQESLKGLQEIAAFEAAQPGRKMVFLIGPGWPMLINAGYEATDKQRAWVFNMLVDISNSLREAHVALYSLDPFGLGFTQG